MSLKFIHGELQHWAAYYELMRFAGRLNDEQYKQRIERLVVWAKEELAQEGGVPEEKKRQTLQDMLKATITL